MSQAISLAYKGKFVKKAPGWVTILDAAAVWGIPPWKIGGGTKTLWFARHMVRQELLVEFKPRPPGS